MPAQRGPARRHLFPVAHSTRVDGFVRTLGAIGSECWTGSDQNTGRHQVRTPGRLPSESAVSGAEAVLRTILEIALKPSIELRQLAKEAVSKSLDPDPLLAFSSICRADLDHVRRTYVW